MARHPAASSEASGAFCGSRPAVLSIQQESPLLQDYGLRLAASTLNKNNHQLQRDSLAAVKRHLKRLDLLRREAGEPSLFGLLWCDAEGHVSVGGSPAFLTAADAVRLRTSVKEHFEVLEADLDAPLDFPDGLPPLAANWQSLPRNQTKALLHSTLRHLNGGKRLRFTEQSRPEAWPETLRFANPLTASALDPEGRSGGASLLHLLRFAISALYANSGEEVERLPLCPAVAQSPTPAPASSPTPAPASSPTPAPASSPTPAPASSPTPAPASSPTPAPASSPTPAPASSPTPAPASSPTPAPASSPTPAPASPSPAASPTPVSPASSDVDVFASLPPSPTAGPLTANSEVTCEPVGQAPSLPHNSYQVPDEGMEELLRLLRERHPEVGGLASPTAVASGTSEAARGPLSVFVHCVDGHWTASALLDGSVKLYDSLRLRPNPRLYKALAGVYPGQAGEDGEIRVEWMELPLQVGSTTCGWWAMAFLVELAAGRDPASRTFPAEPDVVRCLQEGLRSGELGRLSLQSRPNSVQPARTVLVSADCCGDFAKSERWVECERCREWRHATSGCTGLRPAALRRLNASVDPHFVCPACSNLRQEY